MALTIPSIFTAIDKFTAPVEKMQRAMGAFGGQAESSAARIDRRFTKLSTSAQNVALKSGAMGFAIAAPLALAVNSAIDFEDKMADVAKTTGLQGKELANYGESILNISSKTRTSITDLVKIAEIGGQLGVAKEELISFTEASNKFAVALGADYGGTEQAITQVGKLNKLFSDTKGLDISSSITKAGSAINELGAVGAGTSANINDFALRMGALPNALKPSFTSTAALGTYLEELGINAEIGAGGLTKVFLDAGNHIGAFAKQMHLSGAETKKLLAQDPVKFVAKLSETFNGLKPEVLSKTLKGLGVESQESIKVLGALGANTARLTELQKISNDAFAEGTSLQAEYAKKNDTVAAKIGIAKNNMQVLGITIGAELLPMVIKVTEKLIPMIQKFGSFVKAHPGFVKMAVALAAILFAISGIASIISVVSTGIAGIAALAPLFTMIAGALTNFIIPAFEIFFTGLIAIGEIVAGALGLGFGAFIAILLAIVGIFISFYAHWDMIVKAFKDGGIVGGLKAIGATLLDVILYPLQKILEAASNLPSFLGGGLAASGAASIEGMRAQMGLTDPTPAASTKATQQEVENSRTEKTTTNKVVFDFKNVPKGMQIAGDAMGNNMMPNLTSTMGF